MSSVSDISKTRCEFLFLKRLKAKRKEPTISIVNDFKILLILGLVGGIPFSPHELSKQKEDGKLCQLLSPLLSALFHLCRTIVWLVATYFSYEILPSASLVITNCIFNFCSLTASWTLFFKRQAILKAMQSIIDGIQRISSPEFKSSWNIYTFLLLHILGVLTISVAIWYVAFLNSAEEFKHLPVVVFGFEIDEKYNDVLLRAIMVLTAFTFTLDAFSCGLVVLISSTMYFHLADTIRLFGEKVKMRFQQKVFSPEPLASNLTMLQEIVLMNQEVNRAVSFGVFFFYGAAIACFIQAVSLALSFGTTYFDLFILDVFVFIFAMTTFITVTLCGNRVKNMSIHLRLICIECSRILIAVNPGGKIATYSSLLINDIRSAEFAVSGGGMFTISNGFILTIAGVLITYGVLIFQVDDLE